MCTSSGKKCPSRLDWLIDPDSTICTAGEIREVVRLAVDLDYLRGPLKERQAEAGFECYLERFPVRPRLMVP
jgi:hypothetical protein